MPAAKPILQNLCNSNYTDFFVTNRNRSRDHKLGFKKLCDFLKKNTRNLNNC